MARMEFLCFELMGDMYDALQYGDRSPLIDVSEKLGCAEDELQLDICWAPHKLAHDGCPLKPTACEANDRTDFFLVALCPAAPRPIVLLDFYHTTNVTENTSSGSNDVPLSESRILVSSAYGLLDVMDSCVKSYVQRDRRRQNRRGGRHRLCLSCCSCARPCRCAIDGYQQ